MNKELSLYVHIPFCIRKCLYCDFLSFNASGDLVDEYFKALGKEIAISARKFVDYEVKSIFFGGGTPSLLTIEQINTILSPLKYSEDAEITLEFEDEGFEYNPLTREDPDINLPPEKRPEGGLGIFMVKQMAESVDYDYTDNKNILTITLI